MKVPLGRITDLATLTTCALVCAVLVQQRFGGATGPSAAYHSGEVMDTFGAVDYAMAPRTLLLFVRSTCRFCTDSMSLYREVADSSGHRVGRFRMVVVSAEDERVSRRYLSQYNVAVDQYVALKPGAGKFNATPTLVVVAADGKVQRVWVGELGKKSVAELFTELEMESLKVSRTSKHVWNPAYSS